MTDVFEVVDSRFPIETLAKELFTAFKQKEENEIHRISQMISFFESNDYTSLKLARYFGDQRQTEPCGHCSVCQGGAAQLPYDLHLPPLSTLNPKTLCSAMQAATVQPLSDGMLTRFLCGISTPLFTRIKARSLPNFGRLEQYRYQDVKSCL